MADNEKKSSGRSRLILSAVIILVVLLLIRPMLSGKPGEEGDGKDYYTPSSYSINWHNSESNVGQSTDDDSEAQQESQSKIEGVRDKYTVIKGNNEDIVTIMVYMCGTDLESQGSMASYDLSEMAAADIGKNVNVIVYTGGCKSWHINGISSKNNQIYKLTSDGKLQTLVENAGTSTMVNPDNLTDFIEFCAENYEADRYELIFWDHGGGTISGYGYDEKYPNAGSMTLDKIDQALTEAGIKFDFIGFDACLMSTTENALMLANHADYMIASEESEPGIGWYYTDWLNALGKNSSMSTVSIGKTIADSFVSRCSKDVPGQSATLSVVDLAQLQGTIGKSLSSFAQSTSKLIDNGEYRTVASARASSREFGTSSGVDMVDLVDLINHLDTPEGKELKKTLLSCIKYNNTSSDMSNSYGLSIYFPYRSPKYVNTVINTYDKLEMDESYAACIKSFASYQTSGQLSSGGSHNAYQSFDSYDSSSYYGGQGSAEDILNILNLFLGGEYQTSPSGSSQGSGSTGYSDYYSGDWSWLFGEDSWSDDYRKELAGYVADNHFDADLTWKNGKIKLTKEQWSLISDLQLNMFIDDGEGYIDLGKDNIYDIDKNGDLLKQDDLTWLAASADGEHWQNVAYYYISSLEDGDSVITTGRIPVLLNGQSANILIQLDNDGIRVIGASFEYDGAGPQAKNLTCLKEGDEITFVCDYYDYDGSFQAAYALGDKLVITDQLLIGDMDISSYKTLASYEFTDIYQQHYWTTEMK